MKEHEPRKAKPQKRRREKSSGKTSTQQAEKRLSREVLLNALKHMVHETDTMVWFLSSLHARVEALEDKFAALKARQEKLERRL